MKSKVRTVFSIFFLAFGIVGLSYMIVRMPQMLAYYETNQLASVLNLIFDMLLAIGLILSGILGVIKRKSESGKRKWLIAGSAFCIFTGAVGVADIVVLWMGKLINLFNIISLGILVVALVVLSILLGMMSKLEKGK